MAEDEKTGESKRKTPSGPENKPEPGSGETKPKTAKKVKMKVKEAPKKPGAETKAPEKKEAKDTATEKGKEKAKEDKNEGEAKKPKPRPPKKKTAVKKDEKAEEKKTEKDIPEKPKEEKKKVEEKEEKEKGEEPEEEEGAEEEEAEEEEEKEEFEIVEEEETYSVKLKPEISAEMKQQLEVRRGIKKKTPVFNRQEWFRYKKLGPEWRKPRGLHSKTRKHKGFRKNVVSIGYGSPTATRNLHPSGFREIMVHNISDLEKIDPKIQAARVGHSVGTRKRIEIEEKAEELGIRILNPRR